MDQSQRNEQFMRLFTDHQRELRAYIFSLLPHRSAADDVFQETSVALLKKFTEYDANLPFFNWACRFAYYEVLKARKQQRILRKYFSETTLEHLAQERIEEQDLLKQRREILRHCLERLAPKDRDLLGMRYAAQTTIAQLASDIGTPAKQLYRALERIRHNLIKCVNRRLAAEDTAL